MPEVAAQYGFKYEHVAASQTAHVLGTTGAIGDYLHRLIITVEPTKREMGKMIKRVS